MVCHGNSKPLSLHLTTMSLTAEIILPIKLNELRSLYEVDGPHAPRCCRIGQLSTKTSQNRVVATKPLRTEPFQALGGGADDERGHRSSL